MNADKPITSADIIQSLIQAHNRTRMSTCINYYKSDNEKILSKETNDFTQTNIIPSGFYGDIVDQTANYVVGKPITIVGLKDDKVIDPNTFITQVAINAAKIGIGWVYLYIENKKLVSKVIDPYEVLPIWDTNFQDELIQLIRYYKVEVVTNAGATLRTRVECWDKDKVVYYIEDEQGILGLDFIFAQEAIQYHISTSSYVLNTIVGKQEKGWGIVPFIPLKFNKELQPELSTSLKSMIDAYDSALSGFSDDLGATQDTLLLLKDRSAESYDDLMYKIKKYKCLKVDDTGDAQYLVINYPFDARKAHMDGLKESIYDFAKGVDVTKLTRGGGQITTAYIESLFFKLDQKGDQFIKQINEFLKLLYKFVNLYNTLTGGPLEDIESLEFSYDKSRPDNLAEKVATANSCKDILSLETVLTNHPYVIDVKEEIARIEADEQQYLGGELNADPNTSDIQNIGTGANSNNENEVQSSSNQQSNK